MKSVDMALRFLFVLVITMPLTHSVSQVHACSTVLLKREGVLLLGHNLDESTDLKGFLCINKRDYYKVGSTWHALRTHSEELPSSFNWISRYGSVTWTSIGRDLPDAGVNEAGLVIEEMSLAQHPYPWPVIRPRLFQMQWIQYHLDRFSTVEEVIESASVIHPDGWPWHFFVADRSGRCASLEYIDNRLVVHTGETMPVTVLCNSPYAEELKALKAYAGFGGTQAIDPNNQRISRFARAAHMLQTYDPALHDAPVDYVFKILEKLGASYTRRSYVVDLVNDVAYFRTDTKPGIRQFSLKSFDFSCGTPVQVLDMDAHDSGDVTGLFEAYTFQVNHQIAASWVDHAIEMYPDATEADRVAGGISTVQVDRYARYPERSFAKHELHTRGKAFGLSPLHWAAYQGDLLQLRDMLQGSAHVNVRSAAGATPLMHAAQAGELDVLQCLMDAGADLDLVGTQGNTALITALAFGQSDVASALIQAGTKVNAANKEGFTAFHYAAAHDDLGLVKDLMSREAPLQASAQSGLTPLMIAVTAGRAETVNYLLAQGQDPNALDNHGNNALLLALIFKHTAVAEILIRAGTDLSLQNEQDETPWQLAAANGDKRIMHLLKQAGVSPPSHGILLVLGGLAALGGVSLAIFRIRSRKKLEADLDESSGTARSL